MNGVRVRPFRQSDVDDLRKIYLELYDERDAGAPVGIHLFATRPTADDEGAWFERQWQRVEAGDLLYLVAEVGGEVVGSCQVGRVGPTASSEQGHVGELGILVRRDVRGRGVGSALLERSLAEARTKFEVVYLSVFSNNLRARNLYERCGFSVCGHLPRTVKRGDQYYDMERMVLDLSPPPRERANG
jgi:RimJ/RimL family protein N-acetyltransferase